MMQSINIHDAKTHFSRLVEQAAKGESFIIAKSGKPMFKVIALDTPSADKITLRGFLKDQIKVPADFDTMGKAEIESMFGTGD